MKNRKPLAPCKTVNCLEMVILKQTVERDLRAPSNVCPVSDQSEMESLSMFLLKLFLGSIRLV